HEYWEKRSRGFGYDYYIEALLGPELQWVSKNPSRLRRMTVHTLALTVGESFEPLLQSVCVLRPQRVVFILNSRYGNRPGEDHGQRLKHYMLKLPEAQNLPEKMRPELQEDSFERIELNRDTPTQVFRELRKALQKPQAQPPDGSTNVVDITGAKRSMMVGAFLYAAHSGIPITYVDFDKYDTQWGRPYGYTCRIGEITNPYEAFHLRDWEQVRRLYESYSFRNARELLKKVAKAMSQPLDGEQLFDQTDLQKVARLTSMLEMYEAWENGDYVTAKARKGELSLPPDVIPSSIDVLGDIWPHAGTVVDARQAADRLLGQHLNLKQGDLANGIPSLFARPIELLAYVRDELAKIERLITKNEDYRSAYLRAAGLDEFLLKARLAICWLADKLAITVGTQAPVAPSTLSDQDREDVFKALVNHSGADAMRNVLQRQSSLQMKNLPHLKGVKIDLAKNCPQLEEYWKGKALDFDKFVSSSGNPGFTKLRGEAIHTHLYIPHKIAEAALELVRAAVREFESNWIAHVHSDISNTLTQAAGMNFAAPTWERLCDVCELSFLPPRLR
ncbi:hypothetical protein, partial [Roseiflexus sp.]|uniref:hypothetical protein n=1 Tax=Roseiflexus sp. TaxID=2562120 RepID=UPI00398B4029